MLKDLINQSLRKEQENKRIRSDTWSPFMFGRCYRAQYWYRKGETPTNPPDDRALRIFKVGHIFHDFVEKLLPDHQTEVPVKKDDVSGRLDIVDANSVLDVKSVHSKAFWYMTKEVYDIAKEKFNNWLQVAWGAWALEKEKCGLIFVSKDDLCIKEYYMDTSKWVGELNKELDKLREYWSANAVPSCQPRAYNGKECKYCNWRDKCKHKAS